jgi:hypothetical protein
MSVMGAPPVGSIAAQALRDAMAAMKMKLRMAFLLPSSRA